MLISTTLISLVLATARIAVCAPFQGHEILEASDTITSGTGVEQRVIQENDKVASIAEDCGKPPPPGGGCACCHHGSSEPKVEDIKIIESLTDTPIITPHQSKGIKNDQEEQLNDQLQGIRSKFLSDHKVHSTEPVSSPNVVIKTPIDHESLVQDTNPTQEAQLVTEPKEEHHHHCHGEACNKNTQSNLLSATTAEAVPITPEIETPHADHSGHDHSHDQVVQPILTPDYQVQKDPVTVSDRTSESDDAPPQAKAAGQCTGSGCGHRHGPINRDDFKTLNNAHHNHDKTAQPILTTDSQVQKDPVNVPDKALEINDTPPIKEAGKCTGSSCGNHGSTNQAKSETVNSASHKHDDHSHDGHDHSHEDSSTLEPIRSEISTLPPKEKHDDHDHHGHGHGEPSKFRTLGNSIEKNWNRFINFFKNLWKSIKNQTNQTIKKVSQFRRKTAKRFGMRPSGPIHEDVAKVEKEK